MAAPSATARQTPTGIAIDEGFSIKITFSRKPALNVWEISAQPPGVDGGDGINKSTQHNTRYMTKAPKALIELTNSSMTVAYDPGVLADILDMCHIDQTITFKYPDGTTHAFYGFLKSFIPSEMSMGNLPTAAMEIIPSNYDATNNVEAAPVLTSVTGT